MQSPHRMHARYAVSAALAGFMVFLAGCTTPSGPLPRDKSYPADWPEFVPVSEEGTVLSGTYANAGTITNGKGGVDPVVLLSLLPADSTPSHQTLAKSFANCRAVTLQAVSRKNQSKWKPPAGNASILVAVDADPRTHAKVDGFCAQTGFAYQLENSAGALAIAFAVSGSSVILNKGTDGSLIARIDYDFVGLFLIVPMWSFTHQWACFRPVEAPKATPAPPPAEKSSAPAPGHP